MTEIELKFLDIDVEEIINKLEKLGAELKYDTHIESYSFSSSDFHISDSNMKYLRVRRVNGDVEVTYKDSAKKSDMTVREEINIEVNDFEQTVELIEKLGFKKDKIFTKHRVHYELGNIHFELDTLDGIPTYLEIETQTEEEIVDVCKKLELDISKGRKGTIVEILPERFKG
jgi:adenylate cyclase class 2